jgi:hypothetical protein
MDDLDELLTPGPVPPEPPGLRATVERAATGVLRRRRWLGRARWAAALAGCYAAGLATMWLWSETRRPPQREVVEQPPAPESVSPSPAPPAPLVETDPYHADPPERLERWAFLAHGAKRVDLYRRAGDGYLARDDVSAALRCYRRALDGASLSDLVIRADKDTWLLMSLKMSRQKEKLDARVN